MPEPQLYDKAQALEFLHARGLHDLNEKWLSNQMDRGDLPYVVVARRRRIQEAVLQRMFDEWLKDSQ